MTEQAEAVVDTTMEATDTQTDPAGSEQTEVASEATEQTSEAAAPDTEVQDAAEDTPDDKEGAPDTEELIFTPVYNGAVQPIKASDTARVTTLLQKGMKFENMTEDLEKMHRLSAAYGTKSVSELLDLMLGAREKSERESYVRKYGKEAGERLYELENAQRAQKAGSFKEAQAAADEASSKAIHERLAGEFTELQGEYPTLASIKEVPKEAINLALQKGISLLDAYNRYTLKQQRRTDAAARQQAKNEQSSVGSVAGSAANVSDPVWEAFMQGVARRS